MNFNEVATTMNFIDNLIGDYEKSLLYTDQMLELAAKYDTTKIIKVGHQRLKGSLLSKLRRQEEAVNFINKSLDEAITLLNAAIKIEPKNADNYLLMGDALLEKNPTEGGPAIKQYDKFSELNPKSPKGILRAGKLYQRGPHRP